MPLHFVLRHIPVHAHDDEIVKTDIRLLAKKMYILFSGIGLQCGWPRHFALTGKYK